MATDSFVQVAIDGAGKKIRNFFNVIGADTVYQQVVTLAKSDGTLLDSGVPITAAALPLPAGAATDAGPLAKLDVALSTRTKPSDQQHAIIDSGSVSVSNLSADQLVHAANLDVAVSTLLKPGDTLTKVATVDTITNPVAVTGAFFQTTQPVSGTVALSGDALESLRTQRTMIGRATLRPRADKLRRIGLHA